METRQTTDLIPFALAMASISASPSFPIILLDDEAAISVDAVAPLASKLGQGLTGKDSLHGLLQNWDANFAALRAIVTGLDDHDIGKYVRSSVTAIEFFDLHAPVASQRQVFLAAVDITMLPATTIAGPKAKVPMPAGATSLVAGLALAIVIGAPAYRATKAEASAAIAGYSVATRYRTQDGESWSPAFLPIGPMMLPRDHAEIQMTGRISFNGETGMDGTIDQKTAIAAVERITARVQLFPGDIIICPMGDFCTSPLNEGDIIETAIAGLGQQTTNIIVESKHAHPRN